MVFGKMLVPAWRVTNVPCRVQGVTWKSSGSKALLTPEYPVSTELLTQERTKQKLQFPVSKEADGIEMFPFVQVSKKLSDFLSDFLR